LVWRWPRRHDDDHDAQRPANGDDDDPNRRHDHDHYSWQHQLPWRLRFQRQVARRFELFVNGALLAA
jgi:hypothetical protein